MPFGRQHHYHHKHTATKFGTVLNTRSTCAPKSRRAKVWILPSPLGGKTVWFLPSTSEQNISDDAARTVVAISGPTNKPSVVRLNTLLAPRRYHEWIPKVGA